ncbi:hypothetical protein ABW19_dt0208566 [Dactylella cylindrospora]|nr:hypothetical protein ABW19_dt0208566 [Dactylella cylindrospora]
MGEGDVIINLRGLNSVEVDKSAMTATIGGGAIVKEIVDETYNNEMHYVAGGCNGVSTGGLLGAGLGRLMGEYGLGIDNLLSLNLVTAEGNLIHVTPTSPSPDLWWGLRGAGHNFGIVTSYTIRTYPWINGGVHFAGPLIFTGDKVEEVTAAINSLEFKKPMSCHYYFAVDPSSGQPVVIVEPFYAGTVEDGKEAFKPLIDVGPVVNMTGPVAWNVLNSSGDFFGTKGSRKPGYSAGMVKLDPTAYRNVWDSWTTFIQKHGTDKVGRSAILTECYCYETVRKVDPASTAFPHRDINFQAVIIPWYDDPELDIAAEGLASYVRKQWRSTSGLEEDRVYVNFARGDEALESIYGESWRIEKLKSLKAEWDPLNKFGQYLPISGCS